MVNIPSYDVGKISLGTGIVFLGPVGFTPVIDVGTIESTTIEISSSFTDIVKGEPERVIDRYLERYNVSVTLQSLEWNLENFNKLFPASSVTYDYVNRTTTFQITPDTVDTTKDSLMITHQTPAGDTIELYLWKVVGEGTLALPFTRDLHRFNYSFRALACETSWSGSTLSSIGSYLQLVYYD